VVFPTVLRWALLVGATLPFLYYLLAILSAWKFFRKRPGPPSESQFTPPVSILKPVRGLDREAYENFASFCRLDYPRYEILFAVGDTDDPAIPVIRKLIEDFPHREIRLWIGSDCLGTNRKVTKLCRLVAEARYDLLVINDSDVRVDRDYLRAVVAPFEDPKTGAVTCMFRGMVDGQWGSQLEALGDASEFLPGVLVAWQLEGVKFALGATMATTRQRLAEIGGFEALADFHSDDYQLGKRIAERGYRVELIPYTVWLVCPSQKIGAYLRHALRWWIGLRHIRPRGHLGTIFTHGLPWSLAAGAVSSSQGVAAGYLAAYVVLRFLMVWTVGIWGLKDPVLRRRWWLVPVRDALAFFLWVASFASNRINWRGTQFYLQDGRMVPVLAGEASEAAPARQLAGSAAISPKPKEESQVTR